MMQRAFFSAFAAILLSATLIQTAAAYPSTARSGTSTVTGTYRPLDLNLDTLVNGTDALNYIPGGGPFSFQVDLTGTFTGDGYDASGNAGIWRLVLSEAFNVGITSNNDGDVIFLSSTAAGLQVGTLTYLGDLIVNNGTLPYSDTPIVGDFFKLFTTVEGGVLRVNCDNISTCNGFDLTGLQDLKHIGPYVDDDGETYLDSGRLNEECVGLDNSVVPCGSVTGLTASSVPEPATLALLGLGLAGLGLSRRTRA